MSELSDNVAQQILTALEKEGLNTEDLLIEQYSNMPDVLFSVVYKKGIVAMFRQPLPGNSTYSLNILLESVDDSIPVVLSALKPFIERGKYFDS